MKSILQQAPSIMKAVKKAWESSGKPQEFNIKILEFEDKNFLGWSKKPATIKLSFLDNKPIAPTKPLPVKKEIRPENRPNIQNIQKISTSPTQTTNNISKEKTIKLTWRKEFIDDISSWFAELLKILSIDTKFSTKVDQKILKIYIDKRIFKDAEEEKAFFIGLSHVLMQFLKRKYRKKFKNFFLIIHTKTSDGDNK